MSDAASVAVAKAVTAMLTAATLSQAFTPERSYLDWQLELKGDESLHVDVVVATTEQSSHLAARGSLALGVPVDIAVRQKFALAKQDEDTGRVKVAEVDALCLLVQEIHELFTPQRLTDFEAGVWQDTKILVCPLLPHLRTLKQFTGIVRVVFEVQQ